MLVSDPQVRHQLDSAIQAMAENRRTNPTTLHEYIISKAKAEKTALRRASVAATILEYLLALSEHHKGTAYTGRYPPKWLAFALTRKNIQVSLGLPWDRLPETGDGRQRNNSYSGLTDSLKGLRLSDEGLNEIWQEWRSVAHFWLARDLLEERYGHPTVTKSRGASEVQEVQVEKERKGYSVLTGGAFRDLINVAHAILQRSRGVYIEEHVAGKRRQPTPVQDWNTSLRVSGIRPQEYSSARIPERLLSMVLNEEGKSLQN